MTEDQMAKENAYILFYVRKDVHDKKLEELMPSILEIFPGKPVKCKQGDGFVLGAKVSNDLKKKTNRFVVKIKQEIVEVKRDDILPDPDQNDAMLDEREKQSLLALNPEYAPDNAAGQLHSPTGGLFSFFSSYKTRHDSESQLAEEEKLLELKNPYDYDEQIDFDLVE